MNKSMHGKLDMHKCIIKLMHILNFACAAIIGDNVDREKSAILMQNSKHCACFFESMPLQSYNSF